MKKSDVIHAILGEKKTQLPRHTQAKAYAPSNIALCKYWGKRDQELNLPVTSSLSISLGDKGTTTELSISRDACDTLTLNGQPIEWTSSFGKRLLEFYHLFRVKPDLYFDAKIQTNIPIGAGLASSACGFASMVQALNGLFGWKLNDQQLSILARLGSGSASRSIQPGFVQWHVGVRADGLDSYGELIPDAWPELCIGLVILNDKQKSISSRDAMQRTITTSALYPAWSAKVSQDLAALKHAISLKDFNLLGKTAESNALTMHATMLSAWPPVCYTLPETLTVMQKIWQLRQEGLNVFFTQDAGANLKLLFLAQDRATIQSHFSQVEIIQPFN